MRKIVVIFLLACLMGSAHVVAAVTLTASPITLQGSSVSSMKSAAPIFSLALMYFGRSVETAFIRFDVHDTDTLHFTIDRFGTKCCGDITDITHIRYGDSTYLNRGNLILTKRD